MILKFYSINKPQYSKGRLKASLFVFKKFLLKPRGQWVRDCFHPGVSSLSREPMPTIEKESVSNREMIGAMLKYIWPADDPHIRRRVLLSLGLLVSAKVTGIGVPFLFKYAIDNLSTFTVTNPVDTIITFSTSLLIACKY